MSLQVKNLIAIILITGFVISESNIWAQHHERKHRKKKHVELEEEVASNPYFNDSAVLSEERDDVNLDSQYTEAVEGIAVIDSLEETEPTNAAQSDETENTSSEKEFVENKEANEESNKDSSRVWWVALIIGVVMAYQYLTKKSGSSNSGESKPRKISPKVETNDKSKQPTILKWYLCENCGTKINAQKKPSGFGCPKDRFHNWHKM